MAKDLSTYLTEDDFVDSRIRQDKLLHEEFGKVWARVNELKEEYETESKVVLEECAKIGVKLDLVDQRLGQRIDSVDERLGQRIDRVDERLVELNVNILRISRQQYNNRLTNLYARLEPIPVYRPGEGILMPTVFPKNAYDFWHLKSPKSKKHCKHPFFRYKLTLS
jgi:hypothetical protein